ncbi:MAG: Na(+)-translocating NADH-quinone reductase subunit A [Deltaproteobacteria bacterium]|nr:Na(+)-translocating NADH-quinone reductase subunit A [Deltaproteobacteria bacterium]
MIEIQKGLDLPIEGEPVQELRASPKVTNVAVLGPDFHGMKPTMAVQEGDRVVVGQELFSDKKNPGVVFTSPGSGKVTHIHRGERRTLMSVVIHLDEREEFRTFQKYEPSALAQLSRDEIRSQLLTSGQWVALRTRPFSKVPAPDSVPAAIFVNAMDSNPLAPYPNMLISREAKAFEYGLTLLSKLTDGKLYLCQDSLLDIRISGIPNLSPQIFGGPHPCGLAGTHIHFLEPVSLKKTVWTIGYQDVIAIGKLFTEGKLWVDRVISLAGPLVREPSLIQARLGASVEELSQGCVDASVCRLISGSVLSGRHASGELGYLGRFAQQISVLKEGTERVFLGWQRPGLDKFSVKRVFASKMIPGGIRFPFTTSREGSFRAMVPVGAYEQVMPMDTEPTFLLRALLTQDTDLAVSLGVLDLDEEDLGLCTFVCPGKISYGPLLRRLLTTIEREG